MNFARRKSRLARAGSIALPLALLFGWAHPGAAYSVLSHEAIIDSAWDTGIRPLLLRRFPQSTPQQLKEAHGYAYGGSIIQDMGYYPHGSIFFSDLTHYVRSGDFVMALLRDAKDLDSYAFALGALAHYAADDDGHRIATNRVVPMLYPRLKKKYGDIVTYEENPLAHAKTEFSFDVLEVAKGNYAPESYHDFIGFGVAAPLLREAFQQTYGLPLRSVLPEEEQAMESYRWDVSKLIPAATRVAWSMKRDDIARSRPGVTRKTFLYNISRSSYRKDWGRHYRRPSLADRFLGFLVRIVPKVGPLRVFELRMPTPEAERLFEASFDQILHRYRELLNEAGADRLNLQNENFDLGAISEPGIYRLSDRTHARLLDDLAKRSFRGLSPGLKADLVEFYSHPGVSYAALLRPAEWAKTQSELVELKTAPVSSSQSSE